MLISSVCCIYVVASAFNPTYTGLDYIKGIFKAAVTLVFHCL